MRLVDGLLLFHRYPPTVSSKLMKLLPLLLLLVLHLSEPFHHVPTHLLHGSSQLVHGPSIMLTDPLCILSILRQICNDSHQVVMCVHAGRLARSWGWNVLFPCPCAPSTHPWWLCWVPHGRHPWGLKWTYLWVNRFPRFKPSGLCWEVPWGPPMAPPYQP